MVYNPTRKVKIPFGNANMNSHVSRIIPTGKGMGSVLLRTGGGGSASSYQDMDDYIRTTGIAHPYNRNRNPVPLKGRGLGTSLSEKLTKLSIQPTNKKKKNIVMSF